MLKKLREQKNLSQQQLADITGISKRTIQGYEQGLKDINKASAETVYRLAIALNVEMKDILDLERI